MPDETASLMADMLRALESAQSQIEVLQGQVATLIIRQGLGAAVLDQPDRSADDDLGVWVAWLIGQYELAEMVPGCWVQHPPIREELSALRAAHVGALDDMQSRPSDLLAWHEALQRALSRMRDWDRDKCRTRGHRRGASEWPPGTETASSRGDVLPLLGAGEGAGEVEVDLAYLVAGEGSGSQESAGGI